MALALTSLVSAQKLQITSPADGTAVSPGQALPVTVAASGGTFKDVVVIGEDPIGSSPMLSSPPYQFTVQIPSAISPRTYMVSAIGPLTSGQLVTSDPIAIDVERVDAPVRIDTNLTSLDEAIGTTSYLLLSATFEDATTLDVTESSLVAYTSDVLAIATVDNVGRVAAVGPGSAHIVATYGKLSLTIPIVVQALLKILPEQTSLHASETREFDAYFNPVPTSGVDITWTLSPSLGRIDADGIYTAPASVASRQGVTLTATSVADPTKSATAQIWLLPAAPAGPAPR
jgi:hypothetical protein